MNAGMAEVSPVMSGLAASGRRLPSAAGDALENSGERDLDQAYCLTTHLYAF
jgi:hypothetical protein